MLVRLPVGTAKQWPLEHYDQLGKQLEIHGLKLVLNVAPSQQSALQAYKHLAVQTSSLSGLIYVTRHAAGVLGVDSGPLHLAAALGKPGVALFGPTDPAQTGPFNSPMTVLRDMQVTTTYKRGRELHPGMVALTVDSVLSALMHSVAAVAQIS